MQLQVNLKKKYKSQQILGPKAGGFLLHTHTVGPNKSFFHQCARVFLCVCVRAYVVQYCRLSVLH